MGNSDIDLIKVLAKKHELDFDWNVRISETTGKPIWSGKSELKALSTQDFAGNFLNNFGCGTLIFLFILLVIWNMDGWVGKGMIILGTASAALWLFSQIKGKVFEYEWSVFATETGLEFRDYLIDDDVDSDARVGDQWQVNLSDVANIKSGRTVSYEDQRLVDGKIARISDREWCSLFVLKDGSYRIFMLVEAAGYQTSILAESIKAYLETVGPSNE